MYNKLSIKEHSGRKSWFLLCSIKRGLNIVSNMAMASIISPSHSEVQSACQMTALESTSPFSESHSNE